MSAGRISDRVKALFPVERVYTDHEVAKVIYRGQVRAMRKALDKSPLPLFYRGPQNARLMTREHIEKTIRRFETCIEAKPANSNLHAGRILNSGGSQERLTGGASAKALKLLTELGPKNKGSR